MGQHDRVNQDRRVGKSQNFNPKGVQNERVTRNGLAGIEGKLTTGKNVAKRSKASYWTKRGRSGGSGVGR